MPTPTIDPTEPTVTHILETPSHDEIAERAFRRYLERGAVDGADFDDWLDAERDLLAERSGEVSGLDQDLNATSLGH